METVRVFQSNPWSQRVPRRPPPSSRPAPFPTAPQTTLCVCVIVCASVCARAHMHAYVCMCARAHTHACLPAHASAIVRAHVCVYFSVRCAHMRVRMHVHANRRTLRTSTVQSYDTRIATHKQYTDTRANTHRDPRTRARACTDTRIPADRRTLRASTSPIVRS